MKTIVNLYCICFWAVLLPFSVVLTSAIDSCIPLHPIANACPMSLWSNYRPEGRMWPATELSGARKGIQEKCSNLKFFEKRERLHLSHCIAYAG